MPKHPFLDSPLMDAILRADEDRRAILGPYIDQIAERSKWVERLGVGMNIDPASIGIGSAAQAAIDHLGGDALQGMRLSPETLRLTEAISAFEEAARLPPGLSGLDVDLLPAFEAPNRYWEAVSALDLFSRESSLASMAGVGESPAIAQLVAAMREPSYFNLAAQASLARLESLDFGSREQPLVRGVERLSRAYNRTTVEVGKSSHARTREVAELLPGELFGQAAFVEGVAEDADPEPGASAVRAFAETTRPRLRAVMATRDPRLAEALVAVDEALASRRPHWSAHGAVSMRVAFELGLQLFARDDDVMSWSGFLTNPDFVRHDGKPTWRCKLHYLARHTDPELKEFTRFVGCTVQQVKQSINYLNSHVHPSETPRDLARLQTAQARVEGVLYFMLSLSRP
jgi:hypothetical protein